jgi:predicted dinucleotide-binding enzyme
MENLSVSIIGIGRVGGALALALSKKKYRINYLVARDFKKAANLALTKLIPTLFLLRRRIPRFKKLRKGLPKR